MSTRILSALVALAGLGLSCSAHAATYRCDVGGTLYITDKPCAPTPAGPAPMGAIGPTRQLSSYQPRTPGMEQAPEHHRFLSQRCAELNDAIRTAPTRGVGYATVSDLRREYEQKCSEDDQYARRQAGEARRKEREGVQAQRNEAERSRQDAELMLQRCVALRDALRNRRADTDADRATKRVAEEAYNSNCLGK